MCEAEMNDATKRAPELGKVNTCRNWSYNPPSIYRNTDTVRAPVNCTGLWSRFGLRYIDHIKFQCPFIVLISTHSRSHLYLTRPSTHLNRSHHRDNMADPWGASYIASIAQCLNSVGIPCILWGHCLLNLHGIPSIIGSIDFVIADESLIDGAKPLSRLSYLLSCTNQESCLCNSQERSTPPPAFHMHMKDSEVTVGLYTQSETLWFLPRLDQKLAFPSTSKLPDYFVLASDQTVLPPWRPGRGSGVFHSTQGDLVIAPKSYVLLEAFMRLFARDSGTRIGACAMPMIAYVEEYVDEDGYLDIEKLVEPLRGHYLELREGKKPVRQWRTELRHSLGVPEVGSDDD